MKVAKKLFVVVDYNKEDVEIYSLSYLLESDDIDLTQEEREVLLSTSRLKSNGRLYKLIIVDIDVGGKGDEQTT